MNKVGKAYIVSWFSAHFRNNYSFDQNVAAFVHAINSPEILKLSNNLDDESISRKQQQIKYDLQLNIESKHKDKSQSAELKIFNQQISNTFNFNKNSKLLALFEKDPSVLDASFVFALKEYPNNHNNNNTLTIPEMSPIHNTAGLIGGMPSKRRSKHDSSSEDDQDESSSEEGIY